MHGPERGQDVIEPQLPQYEICGQLMNKGSLLRERQLMRCRVRRKKFRLQKWSDETKHRKDGSWPLAHTVFAHVGVGLQVKGEGCK